jgi:Na+-driven multidrug efflux pump
MNSDERAALTTEFWRYLWSAILITLSGCLGNVVDGIIVGNLIGEDGVSAINLSKPVIQLMFTLSILVETGAGMLVGFALGKKDMVRLRYLYTQSMLGCLLIGLAFTAVGLFAPMQTANLLCDNEHLLQPTLAYLRPLLLGAPAYLMMWAISTMVGVDGSPRLVSLAIVIDNAVNLSLDIVFIQCFDWGIAGSSLATIVGHLVCIAIMLRHYWYKDNHLLFSFQHEKPEWANIISQGAPLAVASVCLTLLLYSANSIVLATAGRSGIFIFAVCMNLLQIYNLFLAGSCRTLQSLGAIQVGKADNEAFGLMMRKSFGFITLSMVITCTLVCIFPQYVAGLFGASTNEVLSECNSALRIFALSFMPFCYIYLLMIVYKLYGYHRMALFISVALSLTVIPVMWLVARWAPDYLWYSYLIAYAIEAIAIALIHKLGNIKLTLNKS